jgi:uncharacterized RDD family membrane protein YckC
MAGITVLKGNNVPHGPFTRAEVAGQLSRGEITLDSLAFVDGLSQWTPLRDVLAKVDAAIPPAVGAPPVATVPIGTGYANVPSTGAGGPVGTGYSYAATMQPPGHLLYAGFWLRFAAVFIDGIILIPISIPYLIAYYVVRSTTDDTTKMVAGIAMFFFWLLIIVGHWLYFAMMESGGGQATLGKRAMGILVTDRQGNRISFGRASGRYFGKIISGLIIYIGFMMAGWTERKQALHDMLADTLVVRK